MSIMTLHCYISHEFTLTHFHRNDHLCFQLVISVHYSGHEPAVAGLRLWWCSGGKGK